MSRIHRMGRVVYWSAGALFCVNCIPHVLPVVARKGYELRSKTPPEELVSHVCRIAAAMSLPHPERIQVFITPGFSSACAGTTLLPGGAAIGLPRTVLFRGSEDLSGLVVKGEPVDLESEDGKKLLKLIVPSAQEINFRIAHEVAHLQHVDWLSSALLSPPTLILGYHAAKTLPKYVFPRHATAVFPFVFAVCLAAYIQLTAAIGHWQEHRADHMAGLCSRSYAQGGIEMMEKRIQLENMFKRPHRRISIDTFVSSHPPFEERLQRLEDLAHQTKL